MTCDRSAALSATIPERHGCGAEAHLPFGGNGWSGNGTRESGIWVLDSYTRWQAVNVDLSGKLQKAQIDLVDPEPAGTAALERVNDAIP